jgi:hypothetical protein
MSRKRHPKPGDLTQLRRVVWGVILEIEALLDAQPVSPELILRSGHALAQLATAYTKLVESSELEQRIKALEEQAHATPQTR